MIHPLEARRLLSAAISFNPQVGVLSVVGSDQPDRIEVNIGSKPLYHVNGSGALKQLPQVGKIGNYLNVFDAGTLVYQGFFPGESLRGVDVVTGDGNDAILTVNFAAPVEINVMAESGDDHIQAMHFGATPQTSIFAGEGNDFIKTFAGIDANTGFVVFGEDGDDTIFGSSQNDLLYGDGDEFREVFLEGKDEIYGGDGDDWLYGGAGDDVLCGEAGNDAIRGGTGCDLLDGGSGEDWGLGDCDDKIIDIEKLEME